MPHTRVQNNLITSTRTARPGDYLELLNVKTDVGAQLMGGLLKTQGSSFVLQTLLDGVPTDYDSSFVVEASVAEPMAPGMWLFQTDNQGLQYWFGYQPGPFNEGVHFEDLATVGIKNTDDEDLLVLHSEIRVIFNTEPAPEVGSVSGSRSVLRARRRSRDHAARSS